MEQEYVNIPEMNELTEEELETVSGGRHAWENPRYYVKPAADGCVHVHCDRCGVNTSHPGKFGPCSRCGKIDKLRVRSDCFGWK